MQKDQKNLTFGLSETEWTELRIAIEPLMHFARVWVFGSRARGGYQKFSDIDLLFEVKPALSLPLGLVSKIREKLEDGRLPYKVDLVDRRELAESYAHQVDQEKIEIERDGQI